MMQLVQITAQYSNAVLVAVLPYVSDFAQRLNLPVSTPVSANQVADFRCDPWKNQLGGLVTLTNGFRFGFFEGRVCTYRSPKSYFSLQDPELIPKFYGSVKITENEALKIARDAIGNLGYSENVFLADKPPKVTPPETIGTNSIPRYRFQWLDRESLRQGGGNILPVLLDVEVDASNRRIQMLCLTSLETRRPSPKVDIVPPLIQPQHPLASSMPPKPEGIGWPSKDYARAFLEAILPQISDFVRKAGLNVPAPLSTNDTDMSRYTCVIDHGLPVAQVYLGNGDRFNYQHGRVVAFYAHDAFRKFPEEGRIEDFLGKINMTTNQAISLCARAIKNTGYTAKLPKAWFGGPTYVGTNQFSRYLFMWRNPGADSEFASCEVDMETKQIKSLYLDDPTLWRAAPKLPMPATERTNSIIKGSVL